MAKFYKIYGYDRMMMEDYILPEKYKTQSEAKAACRVDEYVKEEKGKKMAQPMFTTNELRMIEEALTKYGGYYSSPTPLNYAWRELSSKVKTERFDSQINPNFDDDGKALELV